MNEEIKKFIEDEVKNYRKDGSERSKLADEVADVMVNNFGKSSLFLLDVLNTNKDLGVRFTAMFFSSLCIQSGKSLDESLSLLKEISKMARENIELVDYRMVKS